MTTPTGKSPLGSTGGAHPYVKLREKQDAAIGDVKAEGVNAMDMDNRMTVKQAAGNHATYREKINTTKTSKFHEMLKAEPGDLQRMSDEKGPYFFISQSYPDRINKQLERAILPSSEDHGSYRAMSFQFNNGTIPLELPLQQSQQRRCGSAMSGKFARVVIEVDITKPLISRFRVHDEWLTVEYEGLPHICYLCGKVGHNSSACSTYHKAKDLAPSKAPNSGGADKPDIHQPSRRCRLGWLRALDGGAAKAT
ncbi:hypothetical protein Scep_016636 [Stephania cephalantha]|uniref:CCHC-type domain-containing protein n=1 Tax=Stephania cephalantha TaxID=152367 RepID=A0AAP0IN14_9MAGN